MGRGEGRSGDGDQKRRVADGHDAEIGDPARDEDVARLGEDVADIDGGRRANSRRRKLGGVTSVIVFSPSVEHCCDLVDIDALLGDAQLVIKHAAGHGVERARDHLDRVARQDLNQALEERHQRLGRRRCVEARKHMPKPTASTDEQCQAMAERAMTSNWMPNIRQRFPLVR